MKTTMGISERFSISMDRDSREYVKQLAKARANSVSGIIRELIRDAHEKYEAKKCVKNSQAIEE